MNLAEYTPSILRAGPDCPECGTTMDAGTTYHPRLYEPVASWTCPNDECDAADRIREEDAVPA